MSRLARSSAGLALALFLAFRLVARGADVPATAEREIVIASYNVENYLGEEAPEEAGHRRAHAKSEKAIAAVVQVIKDIGPDILGLCEMGSPEEFAAFRERLKGVGLEYSDAEYVPGPDPDRHLALLSRFPIAARQSIPNATYELNGVPEKVKRGFLDVTIRIHPGYDLRMVGVHLKSKFTGSEAENEALMRRHEAALLRKHLDEILAAEPQANLLAYGDFNDTKGQPALQEIMGVRGTPGRLTDLPARDSVGDRWTQYWRVEDLYSRIDYFLANARLARAVVPEKSCVYRSDSWNTASDHRAIYTSILPSNTRR